MAKKEAPKPPTLGDYLLEALTAARHAYTFHPSSYTHRILTALLRAAQMLPKEPVE